MKFLIQHNGINPERLPEIQQAVQHFPHEFVGVLRESREVTANEPLIGTGFIPYGSTLLNDIALKAGWTGLNFDPETFHYGAYCANRDDMLNSGVMRLDEAIEFLAKRNSGELWFSRPSLDCKSYSGFVDSADSLAAFLARRINHPASGSYHLAPDTPILLSTPKSIETEYRWFIVDGKIVSGSMYQSRGELFLERQTDPATIARAQEFADKWLPAPCCVMDLAKTDFGTKVIEFNCINSSGLYACDTNKIFEALWNFHLRREDD